jgi:ferritin-like metal-binding protein YciE
LSEQGEILHSILEQEKATDEGLTDLANSGINEAAIPAANGKSARDGSHSWV